MSLRRQRRGMDRNDPAGATGAVHSASDESEEEPRCGSHHRQGNGSMSSRTKPIRPHPSRFVGAWQRCDADLRKHFGNAVVDEALKHVSAAQWAALRRENPRRHLDAIPAEVSLYLYQLLQAEELLACIREVN